MKSLAEFRQDAGINCNLKKLAAQGELPKGQERVAWAMRVSFFSSQPGKCANIVSACTRLLSSIKCLHFIDSGAAVYFAEKAGRMTEKVQRNQHFKKSCGNLEGFPFQFRINKYRATEKGGCLP